MIAFEDIQDVEDWLEPLDYLGFWEAVAPYTLILQDRDHCDDLISSGEVDADVILYCLKAMARRELTRMFDLKHRIHEPANAKYLTSVH